MEESIYAKAKAAADYITTYGQPTIGVIQGTGLSRFSAHLEDPMTLNYADIPHMPLPTVPTHSSVCTLGRLGEQVVLSFAGRLHYYEGHSMAAVTFPIRVMQLLGIQWILMSNAAGGLNPNNQAGDLVVISDHINTFPENPLRGVHDPRLGVQFPDLSDAYNKHLRKLLAESVLHLGMTPSEGIYLGLQGPTLETPAEYKAYRAMGADLIGMSTVPEVLVANQAKIPIGVVSVVTNVFRDTDTKPTLLEDVVKMVEQVEGSLIAVMLSTIHKLQTFS